MTSIHAVKINVTPPLQVECEFWAEDDGWSGTCYEFSLVARGTSFEDVKKTLGSIIAEHIQSILQKHKQAA